MKVKHRQTPIDIAVLQSGNISGVFELALLNNVSISKELASGEELATGTVINEDIVRELKSRNARPARGIKPPNGNNEGIGYWRVFVDFIVQ